MTEAEEDAELLAEVTAWLLGVGLYWIHEAEIEPLWRAYSDLKAAMWMGHRGYSDDYARGLMAGWAAHERHVQNKGDG